MSVPFHLDWILGRMGWVWPGQPVQQVMVHTGPVLSDITGMTHRVCQYACDRTASCVAYSYAINTFRCKLLSSVSGTTFNQYGQSAAKN